MVSWTIRFKHNKVKTALNKLGSFSHIPTSKTKARSDYIAAVNKLLDF